MIAQWQIEQFHQQGFLVVEEVLSAEEVALLQTDFDAWVEESRQHSEAWGETLDGRPRFDLESDHAPHHPSLRRVSSPTEISAAYRRAALDSRMAAIAGQLIGGSGTRFHHSKINSKLPHTATQVKWHQDFLFTPHSNDDIITALLMVSEVTPENGPLNVVPGSHQGPLWSHWQNARFTGAVDPQVEEAHCQQPQACFGPAGSVCFMHTRLLHAPALMKPTSRARCLSASTQRKMPCRSAKIRCPAFTPGRWLPAKRAAWCVVPLIIYVCRKNRAAHPFSSSRPVPIAPACNLPTLWRFYETY